MKHQTITKNTKIASMAAAVAIIGLAAIQAQGQSVLFNFSAATPDGWVNGGFSSSPASTVVNIGGNNYINIPLGGFQVANVNSGTVSGTPASTFNAAMFAALNNPAGYNLSFDYSIDTSTAVGSTYFQGGLFVNTGSGFYSQVYGSPNALSLNGTQMASGSVFQGTVVIPMSAYGVDANAATETYFRLGIIENGNGTGVSMSLSNISVAPVPEPSTLALAGLGAMGGLLLFRRRLA